ncbi:phosphoribosylanthranilate isomerase [Rhodohalobacter halophilus]|uniref:phosphoribosylanthranilate isomerase n=1 Tax=Rhodohalobacter halophilus TaxID=1812810 RepID=UPI00083FC1A7|nr:phosphoribosylanthranilate isomerase [Rhodohalobacter halophilus]
MFAEPENRTKVKICGLTTLEDARFVSGALADFLGFIFYPESPRYVDPAKAGAIINWLEGPGKVGVFVNQPLDDVNSIAKQTGVDYVQLHGNESPDYCSLVEKPVIKAFHIDEDTDPADLENSIESYLNEIEFILFDTKSETEWGGTGKSFDWKILENITHDKPFFLSGGLKTENVRKAIDAVQPYAVDLSSSLEDSPGLKDFDKIERFFDEMREIWEEQEL